GASKAIEFGMGPAQAIILGTITAVGGGTIGDALVLKIPSVMSEGLYAIPALVAATITEIAKLAGAYGGTSAILGVVVRVLFRMFGVFYKLNAPQPPGLRNNGGQTEEPGE